mmetsp:Transcript_44022/g.84103  ORF Transcript_44022/g.84103 Transcript_44022/m.84103 type:complete len:226 (-) Transcript_44022:961-1638(-)
MVHLSGAHLPKVHVGRDARRVPLVRSKALAGRAPGAVRASSLLGTVVKLVQAFLHKLVQGPRRASLPELPRGPDPSCPVDGAAVLPRKVRQLQGLKTSRHGHIAWGNDAGWFSKRLLRGSQGFAPAKKESHGAEAAVPTTVVAVVWLCVPRLVQQQGVEAANLDAGSHQSCFNLLVALDAPWLVHSVVEHRLRPTLSNHRHQLVHRAHAWQRSSEHNARVVLALK